MSRGPEEVNRLTESTYRNVMEQFNPGLRNLINLGKNYEKAVNAMILAGKAYYDGVAKIGEIASGSPVSTELGHVLIEISSIHKKLNERLDENFRKFHKEIIHELEKKTELDVKYMNATLKRYQAEHRNKLDSLEKSQAELKKIRRKSQGGRNALKYEHKEMEYVETITSRQNEIQKFIADGCKEALLEEKRRFCFLVDKHCSFANHIHQYHLQSAELINSKLPKWQETCGDATKVPEKIMNMIEEIKTPISTPMSGTPLPSPMIERRSMVGRDYDTLSKYSPKIPSAPSARALTSPLIDMFNNPATVAQNSERKNNSTGSSDDPSLQRSVSVATGLNRVKKQKVKTIFPHTAGANQTLLSFAQGDVITLLISEEKDGWLYGEHEDTKVRGWFPSSYTKLLEENEKETVSVPGPSSVSVRSVSTMNLSEKSSVVIPPPDYLECSSMGAAAEKKGAVFQNASTFKAPVSKPETTSPNDANGFAKPPFLSRENPFATVKLRPTVTNDRSAPVIR
ncbi:brain-specific angiogenesis inhibitor 1-associated protein 2-like protein 1 isoform X4 [Lagenorhynchus albirostris]|uniref:BAR/IMD domain-containing adapter protein 2-like 1 n=1 Tax=Tursiops truncatus TaxID=9739 RepID=A0A2U4AZI5_TURTR|nr:brain-specific angiogenesis inhibitor 1-associated protein 2-like protein 1 isoform X1 [Tursiops truncatus]XP_026981579.1 brain-specific angiogenesis inhibitor 1-associated protein 2-like protein 1 isoform X1 [Lagenorhynchus obliquidens]XP_059979749.1 brain-specific angiogenesis inhibitor 1-associated protein 2-like protein 1 isoform X4 [Lagenorhynchus albirostris]